MSRIPPARTPNDRVRTHIKALIEETKHQAEDAPLPVKSFLSGMLSGLAASVEILDGGTAEKSLELMAQRLTAAIGQAYLDGKLPPQPPARATAVMTDVGSPVTTRMTSGITAALARSADPDLNRVIALHGRWTQAGAPPLGTSMARWWDRRLAELHAAIVPPLREQRERPTHPDGTPYRYAEIAAEGWGFCEGCRMWSTATPERPHRCTETNLHVMPTDQPKEQ